MRFGVELDEEARTRLGDYFELDVDAQGVTHAVWGEGLNWDSPGSIWYARGR